MLSALLIIYVMRDKSKYSESGWGRILQRLSSKSGMALMSSMMLTIMIASAATLFTFTLMSSMMAERNVAAQNDFQTVLQNLRVILGDANYCAANLHFDSGLALKNYSANNDIYNVRNYKQSDLRTLADFSSVSAKTGILAMAKNFAVITKPTNTAVLTSYLRTGGITPDGNWRIHYVGFPNFIEGGLPNFNAPGTPSIKSNYLHIVAERLIYTDAETVGNNVVKKKMKMGGTIIQGSIPIDFTYVIAPNPAAGSINSCLWDHEDVNKQFVSGPAYDPDGNRMERLATSAPAAKCSDNTLSDVDRIVECVSFPYNVNTRSFEPIDEVGFSLINNTPFSGSAGSETISPTSYDGANGIGGADMTNVTFVENYYEANTSFPSNVASLADPAASFPTAKANFAPDIPTVELVSTTDVDQSPHNTIPTTDSNFASPSQPTTGAPDQAPKSAYRDNSGAREKRNDSADDDGIVESPKSFEEYLKDLISKFFS